MPKRVLVTGGAGFIGTHITDERLAAGHEVVILDSLLPQIHGETRARPDYLAREAELIPGDVRDAEAVARALARADAVIHLAARVGVGQSMYQIADYTAVNDLGTAILLQEIARQPVERMVIASSMSIYGEGLCRDADGNPHEPAPRGAAQLNRGEWELRDDQGRPLVPIPTPETKRPDLASVYALGKYVQEKMCHVVGQAYGMGTVALRLYNVYGRNQALSNPYTGVLAIFASRLLNGRAPLIFEDGEQRRDFVHARDVGRAFRLALEATEVSGVSFNIGSGEDHSIATIARRMAALMGKPHIAPEIAGRYRAGDIRHNFADVSVSAEALGYRPRVSLEAGLADLVEWLADQIATDRVDSATEELVSRGLVA